LVVRVVTAGAAGSKLYLQYSTSLGSWIDIGANAVHYTSLAAAGMKYTTYFTIPVAARKNGIYIRVASKGGDGAADPIVSNIEAWFKD
jgi:hypothetical protein